MKRRSALLITGVMRANGNSAAKFFFANSKRTTHSGGMTEFEHRISYSPARIWLESFQMDEQSPQLSQFFGGLLPRSSRDSR
jgi:hypothetical protein